MTSPDSAMLAELRRRDPGYALPRAFYVDPAFHRLELEHIFHREWLFAGHSCALAKAGDWFTLQIGAYPVVVVRGRDGRARAFHNVCRHRGHRVCPGARGSSSRLVCPYHHWTYDLEGRLVFARDMMKQVDATALGLKPVACEEVAGWVFVSLAREPRDFAAFRAAVEPYMAPHRAAEAKIAHVSTFVEKGNWKLVMENNRECYHCTAHHPELSRTFSDRPVATGLPEGGEDREIAEHRVRCEAIGLPSAFRIAADSQYRAMRVPLIDGLESMTLSGRAAVRRPLADFPTMALGTMLLFHYPNTWNHLLADHAISFRVLPLSATETEVTTTWLVHRDALEGADYDLKTLTEVWLATNDQDRHIVEGNQSGVNSPAFEPGPYSAVHESSVAQFVDWYSRLMSDRLAAAATAP